MKMALAFICALVFSSCASYVQTLHKQIDREKQAQRNGGPQVAQSPYQNRFARRGDQRPIQNPKTLGGYPVASNQRNVYPQVKRQYRGRTRAEDLQDNSEDGSLWSGENSESFLFVTNNIKKRGDIVIIEVLSKLKDDITEELKRTFPDRPTKKKKKDDEKEEEKAEEAKTAEAPVPKTEEKKVHDKISTQVVEAVNQDYLLVRGRKEVVFKEAKRYIEVQALVSRKHITDNDTVKSDRILEPKIRVLRY